MREVDQNRGGQEQGLREGQGPHQLWLLQASLFLSFLLVVRSPAFLPFVNLILFDLWEPGSPRDSLLSYPSSPVSPFIPDG